MIKEFEYFAPKTLEEALSLLSQYKEDCKIIAGGQSLLVIMKERLLTPRYLINIKGVSALDYINYDENEGLRIGSLTSHRSIEFSPVVQKRFNVLAEMEQSLASVQTRNWGTIGGNLCQADPAGDPAPVLIALNATLKMAKSSGERNVGIEDFFKDYLETALEPDEILTEIRLPIPPPRTGSAYTKFSLQEGDFAIVGTAVSITLGSNNGTCNDARIVLGAAAPIPMRAKRAEKALVGKEINDCVLEEAAAIASDESSPMSDVHASEEYRRDLVKVLVRRVATEALNRAKKA